MADSSLNWKAAIWRANSVLAIFAALVQAFHGDSICFLWAAGAFLEWQLANYLSNEKKGEQDEL